MKRPKIVATGRMPNTALRLPPEVRQALEAYIATLPEPRPKFSTAMRLVLENWLAGHGFLQHRDASEEAN